MSSIIRDFFANSVSSATVSLTRVPGLTSLPEAFPGGDIHQITLITGAGASANADTGFWVANCTRYRVTIERIS